MFSLSNLPNGLSNGSVQRQLAKIESFCQAFSKLSDSGLCDESRELRYRARCGEPFPRLIPQAFALVREAATRILGQRHYSVQLLGGLHLARGRVIEMETGQGKTLTATLPLYLFALRGKGAHLATSNDYLAERDATTMAPLFALLGLSCGFVVDSMSDEDRIRNYACDITYGTGTEFGFDFLRDRMKRRALNENPAHGYRPTVVQRGLYYVLADEADSLLIDDASTPLILGAKTEMPAEQANLYRWAVSIAPKAIEGALYRYCNKDRTVELTAEGRAWVRKELFRFSGSNQEPVAGTEYAQPESDAQSPHPARLREGAPHNANASPLPSLRLDLSQREKCCIRRSSPIAPRPLAGGVERQRGEGAPNREHASPLPRLDSTSPKGRSAVSDDVHPLHPARLREGSSVSEGEGAPNREHASTLPRLGSTSPKGRSAATPENQRLENRENSLRERECEIKNPPVLTLQAYDFIQKAIRVHRDFHLGKQYLIRDDEIVLINESTGRIGEGRQLQDGIHQTIQAFEDLPIAAPNSHAARITVQGLFLAYQHLSGMSGTALSAAREFRRVYKMPVVRIPTAKLSRRIPLPIRICPNASDRWLSIAEEIRELQTRGRAILVGTRSVEKSEQLSRVLSTQGIQHTVLNAQRHADEAEIIAVAGQKGAVTVATGLAGRGTDIKLAEDVREAGGLHVIMSELHDSKRSDQQLFGRCARQGDPGSYRQYLSPEDEILDLAFGEKQASAIRKTMVERSMGFGGTSARLYAAQTKIERRSRSSRLVQLHYEKKRLRSLLEMGLDPILDPLT